MIVTDYPWLENLKSRGDVSVKAMLKFNHSYWFWRANSRKLCGLCYEYSEVRWSFPYPRAMNHTLLVLWSTVNVKIHFECRSAAYSVWIPDVHINSFKGNNPKFAFLNIAISLQSYNCQYFFISSVLHSIVWYFSLKRKMNVMKM